jgi:hypothetical protein
MGDSTFENLRKRMSDDLTGRVKEFGRIVEEIDRSFRSLGLGMAVWHPEKIHTANLGGLDAESYIGYSRNEGKWGLIIRTIERDRETHAFVNQRVYTIGSCGSMEIVVNALKKIPELVRILDQTVTQQIATLSEISGEFEELRSPDRSY